MSTSQLLDHLARSLAEPMPRRRALRLLGGSIAAAILPGVAPSPAQGAARRTASPQCGPDVRACPRVVQGAVGPDKCCSSPARRWGCGGPITDPICVDLCPPPNTPCPSGKVDSDGYSDFACCKAPESIGCCKGDCVPNCQLLYGQGFTPCCAECCNPGQRCKDGKCVYPCADGRERCGTKCCPPNQECRNGTCCSRSKVCGPDLCCGPDATCCVNPRRPTSDPRRWVCCKAPNTCGDDDVCRCPSGEKSCDGGPCCGQDERCSVCFDEASSGPPDLVGSKCCPPRYDCCVKTCCPPGRECCHSKCCPRGTKCASQRGADVCCPAARVAELARGNICCPPGTRGTEEGCCPPGAPNCCPPTDDVGLPIACAAGQVCMRGKCVAV